jgi:hypothetical protein
MNFMKMSSGMLHRVVWSIISVITLIMEAVITCEMLANFYQTTQRNITEDSYLHIHHCENLKSHHEFYAFLMLKTSNLELFIHLAINIPIWYANSQYEKDLMQ